MYQRLKGVLEEERQAVNHTSPSRSTKQDALSTEKNMGGNINLHLRLMLKLRF